MNKRLRIYESHINIWTADKDVNESDPRSDVHYLGSSENKAWTHDQLPVGLLAQLVERCTSIAEVMGSNPVQTWIFFRPYFHYCPSSAHHCEDHFHSCLSVLIYW